MSQPIVTGRFALDTKLNDGGVQGFFTMKFGFQNTATVYFNFGEMVGKNLADSVVSMSDEAAFSSLKGIDVPNGRITNTIIRKGIYAGLQLEIPEMASGSFVNRGIACIDDEEKAMPVFIDAIKGIFPGIQITDVVFHPFA